MKFSDLALSTKLLLLTVLLMTNTVIIGATAWFTASGLMMELDMLGKVHLPATHYMDRIDMAHDGLRGAVSDALLAATRNDNAGLNEALEDIKILSAEVRDNVDQFRKIDLEAVVAAQVPAVLSGLDVYLKEAADIAQALRNPTGEAKAFAEHPKFLEAFRQVADSLTRLGELVSKEAEQEVKDADAMAARARLTYALLIAGGLLLGMTVSYMFNRRLIGDLNRVTGQVTAETEGILEVSSTVAESAQNLSTSNTEQAAAIEETVSSMEEMTAMLSQTTQNAASGQSLAEEGLRAAGQGKTVVSKMTAAMEEIRGNTGRLEGLVALITDIETKTKIINDIVFETRLLSFNASIEAARAGAHGKGFAVVAEEVGKLASMSGKAADEIRSLLSNSTKEVANVVRSTQEKVSLGMGISTECEGAFNNMGEALERISHAINNIASAAREQDAGIKQTNQAMTEMDKVTQRNSMNSENLANQASKLGSGAALLGEAVVSMQRIVMGRAADAPAKLDKKRPEKTRTDRPQKQSNNLSAAVRKNENSPVESREVEDVSREDPRWNSAA